MRRFKRFIALGDSMTEGMNDEIIGGNFRGWADRVADVLSTQDQDFTYMNLAIRGKLVGQVLDEQIPVALPFIGNDINSSQVLVSFHAGANDVLRPKYDPDRTFALYNEAARILHGSGAQVMLFCVLETFAAGSKTGSALAERFREFNINVKKMAEEIGAVLLDPNPDAFWHDKGFMSWDRLHMNSQGHYRAAQGVLARLGMPHDEKYREPLPPGINPSAAKRISENVKWFVLFLMPWIWRRLRGRSSGDGRSAKYSRPIPWPVKR
jgi:lysophospholipase L1-like esterase